MAYPRFTNKVIALMGSLGISESTAADVFAHGQTMSNKSGAVKKFSGYEIGVFYLRDSNTGEYVITHVWKRDRR